MKEQLPTLAERERPGLSQTLTGPRRVNACQSCGVTTWPSLQRWVECDEWDKHDAKSPVVVLCTKCSDRLIQPHPRLYVQLMPMEPRPGAMPLCLDCVHRDGNACTSPLARMNGGEGMRLTQAAPTPVHIKASKPSRSGFYKLYSEWPSECSGRETLTPTDQ